MSMAYRGEDAGLTIQYVTPTDANDYLFPCYCGRGDNAGDGTTAQIKAQSEILSPDGSRIAPIS